MSSGRTATLTALQQYRTTVSSHNRRVLEALVTYVNTLQPGPGSEVQGTNEITRCRVDAISQQLQAEDIFIQLGITTPEQVLGRYDELVPRLGLDGTARATTLSAGERSAQLERYFNALEAAVREKANDEVRESITLPADFRTVAEQVDGLSGPGLPLYQSQEQAAFWNGFDDEEIENLSESVMMPDDLMDELCLNDDWVIGAGWQTGDGEGVTCYIVYVQRGDSDRWSWMYVILEEDGPMVFRSVPRLLAAYSRYGEQNPNDRPNFAAADVFGGDDGGAGGQGGNAGGNDDDDGEGGGDEY